ncbi:UNVERIFIED_CONTAM: putative glutamine amidotransferase [Brevibacillus sp. OAP136]
MAKPLIGFTTYYVNPFENSDFRFVPAQDHIMTAVDDPLCIHKAGGIPIALSVIDDESYMDEILDQIDGLYLAGGSDICPSYYGQPYKKGIGSIVPERDAFEIKLLEKAVARKLPILAICRGFQLVNVFFGGTLIQDIQNYYQTDINHSGINGPRWNIAHSVKLQEGTFLRECFGKEELAVNSFHHQIVDALGTGLVVSAQSDDGVIEGFVHADYPFLVGVQWHPEMMAHVHAEQMEIFRKFVQCAQRGKANEALTCHA